MSEAEKIETKKERMNEIRDDRKFLSEYWKLQFPYFSKLCIFTDFHDI